ncbi:Inherit from KOG: Notch ligand involved in the mediation of Notch signaling (By similarity) [Seminavis robusta]|uniref:Inherit from KOG: Notch ligand involved in the mediation of Notch signaling By similarity n=1 Tax=Seminavis robusta TaxID=568900 RepID=A0A9N8EL05_9STRA|nr:Inherit from KOG: Notch ligand involved in the mediation of Notch signaling (By similarity) [Seminavis robusta]|eukprot:Sro1258_g256860.1 Inherit from KOG: Notch ligand involved in the mediation of Notch signaling (By similarity) (1111) ;mRNA; r:24263-27595
MPTQLSRQETPAAKDLDPLTKKASAAPTDSAVIEEGEEEEEDSESGDAPGEPKDSLLDDDNEAEAQLRLRESLAMADEERRRLEAEAKAEQERLEEESVKAEEERLRLELLALAKMEEERLQREANSKLEQERLEEEHRNEAERLRLEAVAKAEQEQLRREEEAKADENRLRLEVEAKAEHDRVANEKRRLAEEERLKFVEEERQKEAERKRLQEEAKSELREAAALASIAVAKSTAQASVPAPGKNPKEVQEPDASVVGRVVDNGLDDSAKVRFATDVDGPQAQDVAAQVSQPLTGVHDDEQLSEGQFRPRQTKSTTDQKAVAGLLAMEATASSLKPTERTQPDAKPSRLNSSQSDLKSSSVPMKGTFGAHALRPTTTLTTRSSYRSAAEESGDPPKNEFQQIKLKRKSTKTTEIYIKETQLEFAELVAGALNRRRSNNDSSLEALRHMDDLKQEVAVLQEEEDSTLWAINRLRRELLDMFNQGSPMQEEYLLKWIMPLHRERDPKTGRLIMNADQVALLQSFTTSEELSMVAGLGMVRSVLQSNFKAMNGSQCLQDIHDYATFRLGKKSKRAPQNPWDLLADLFETAQKDDSTEDIHQRVCNALVQWVVREILGSTTDEVTSRSCFHAIFLIASLKLELQRLAPKALEPPKSAGNEIDADDDRSIIEIEPPTPTPKRAATPKRLVSPRNPYVEKLLQSDAFNENSGPSAAFRSNEVISEGSTDHASQSAAVDSSVDEKEKAMKEAMLVRDASVKEMKLKEKEKEERIPESELPKPVQDSHRVIRTILGPNHPHINVGDCFEAIRMYAALILKWKEIQDRREQLLAAGAAGAAAGSAEHGDMLMIESKPTFEEEKLKALEERIISPTMQPPVPQIEIGNVSPAVVVEEGDMKQAAAARMEKKRRKKKKKKRKESDLVLSPLTPDADDKLKDGAAEGDVGASAAAKKLDLDSLMVDTAQDVMAEVAANTPTTSTPKRDAAVAKAPAPPRTTAVEEPPPGSPPGSPPMTPSRAELQNRVQTQTQKAIEASEMQPKMRSTFMDRLRRVKLTPTSGGSRKDKDKKKKKKYRHSTGTMQTNDRSGDNNNDDDSFAGGPPRIRRKSLLSKVFGSK